MRVDRRTFLELGGLSLLTHSLGRRWGHGEGALNPSAGRAKREALGLWLPGRTEETLALAIDLPPVTVRPEYERTLESVLICVPANTFSFGAGRDHDDLGRAALERFVDAVFRDLLEALPSYTMVHVAAPSEREDIGLAVLRRAGERRSQLHLVEDPNVEIELWAQDLGEPVVVGGAEKFLVAKPMSGSMGSQSKMSIDRKRVAELVFGRQSTIEASFVFEGGNLAFDRIRGGPRVLVGRNSVSRTVRAYADLGRRISRSAVLADVSAIFGGAEVLELGRNKQSPLLQHIDQAFVILDGGLAVASRLQDANLEVESRQLATYSAQLRELGYKVQYIDHRSDDVAQYFSSVNVVPFVDKFTGRKRILLPVFPGEAAGDAKIMTREVLRGKGARAFDLYRDLGYEPTVIRDLTHSLGGNTHCILNALS